MPPVWAASRYPGESAAEGLGLDLVVPEPEGRLVVVARFDLDPAPVQA